MEQGVFVTPIEELVEISNQLMFRKINKKTGEILVEKTKTLDEKSKDNALSVLKEITDDGWFDS